MIEASSTSNAPPERLWLVVSEVERWGDRLPTFTSVRALEPWRPVGVGSRFEVRQPGLPGATYEMTAWEPGRSFTWVARSPGVVTTASHTVGAHAAGSTVDLALDWTGPLAAVIRRLLGRKSQGMVESEALTMCRLAELE
ncbi:polyketide cyclase/dehydrase/lipid transport protein [Humibacillus xanthopallidus]|uniref:Polyketide cyclase/dehydrase/lipid transport protein n=1 Tax=Humibacillus xanthopallidus TaxID=412689 RepID=A0A543PR95_9MICO|nr:SRPBCC family protein [Humibacillus xanthopallidus]TQN46600.1 polyketide cyclase/dehydrase/lipid transport protein [Humibacillus xanthopallidus]